MSSHEHAYKPVLAICQLQMIKQWSQTFQKYRELFFNFRACILSSVFRDDTWQYMSRAIFVSSFELSKYAATSTADQLVSSNCFIAIQFKTKLNSAVKTGLVFIFKNFKYFFLKMFFSLLLHLSTNASCTKTTMSFVMCSVQVHSYTNIGKIKSLIFFS